MLYSFVNVKRGDKLLEVLFPLRILKVNKYLIILIIITGTTLAVIVSALSIGLVLRFSIITSAANIYYTCKVRDSNIEVNIYTIRNGRVIGCTLAVDTLYSFVNVK
jgi:hypothetical protein